MKQSVQIVGEKSMGIVKENKCDCKVQKIIAAIKMQRRRERTSWNT